MATIDLAQFCFLFALSGTIVAFGFYQIWKPRRPDSQNSDRYVVTAASSVFAARLSEFVENESIVLIPAGDGRYETRLSRRRRRRWESYIELWCKKGAHVVFVVSTPSTTARENCRDLMSKTGTNFSAYFLHREGAPPHIKAEIQNLDTFHPTIVLQRSNGRMRPKAMWIENYHPLNSRFAYQCEFVGPHEISRDPRADKYMAGLLRLLGFEGDVTHIERIEAKFQATSDAA
jgi:hypothetical protein